MLKMIRGADMGVGLYLLAAIIFFIIPLAVLILFIILYNRAKSNTYKKILLSIWIAAAIELLVFVVTALLLLAFK